MEPYPPDFAREIAQADFRLVPKRLQDVDPARFETAGLLFSDSTHVSKVDSDVNYAMLEVLPRVKPGALIYWHDIVIPASYFTGEIG